MIASVPVVRQEEEGGIVHVRRLSPIPQWFTPWGINPSFYIAHSECWESPGDFHASVITGDTWGRTWRGPEVWCCGVAPAWSRVWPTWNQFPRCQWEQNKWPKALEQVRSRECTNLQRHMIKFFFFYFLLYTVFWSSPKFTSLSFISSN